MPSPVTLSVAEELQDARHHFICEVHRQPHGHAPDTLEREGQHDRDVRVRV
jgi:hypothetical protein